MLEYSCVNDMKFRGVMQTYSKYVLKNKPAWKSRRRNITDKVKLKTLFIKKKEL